ncbi:MAG: choice-of-anchor E domain-containing protein [Pseudomonadota bacterium]|nr:choice-of-anchor E domain-containing protein [Pseudomonadota bacterium]
MNIRSTLLSIGLLVGGGAAQAAYVESSTAFSFQSSPIPAGFSVPLFNGSLGTLNSIYLALTTNIVGEIDVYNPGAAVKSFTNAFARIPVTVTMKTPDATSVTAWATSTLASGNAAPGFNAYPAIASSGSNSVHVLSADFANYVGPGTGSAFFTAAAGDGTFGGTTGSNLFFGGSAAASGIFTVRYDYDPVSAVPVPAAAWLLGSGLVSLGATLRRRRAASDRPKV